MRFTKDLGPSISAVSIVAIFIPIEKVTVGILLGIFILGIIIRRVSIYIENKITN